jgi:hypothetical protein
MYNKKIERIWERFGFDFFMILKILTQTKTNANELYATVKQSLYLKKIINIFMY